jgi:hypothetical protein
VKLPVGICLLVRFSVDGMPQRIAGASADRTSGEGNCCYLRSSTENLMLGVSGEAHAITESSWSMRPTCKEHLHFCAGTLVSAGSYGWLHH